MRLKLLLSYDGTAYSGWQIQEKPNPPPTIQGVVEAALFALYGQKIRVICAGRTDAGVHALGQVAHCDVPDRPMDWRHSLNACLPPDIRILMAFPAPCFHARKDAISKTYIYQFWTEAAFTPPHLRNYFWSCGTMNVDAMAKAASMFAGEHDFASFRNAGTEVKSTVRLINSIEIGKMPAYPWLPPHAPALCLTIAGNGFLKQMVRNIAGFLAGVGRDKIKPEALGKILMARDRRSLPTATAPPHGLFLAHVIHRNSSASESPPSGASHIQV